jgi:hypothetical protein
MIVVVIRLRTYDPFRVKVKIIVGNGQKVYNGIIVIRQISLNQTDQLNTPSLTAGREE